MSAATDDVALVKSILDRMLATGDLRSLEDHLAGDLVFAVVGPDSRSTRHQGDGKEAALEYFEVLGDLVTFWRVNYSYGGERVVVVGEENFTVHPGGIEARGGFALVFELRGDSITRLLVVEDLPAWACGPEPPALAVSSTPGRESVPRHAQYWPATSSTSRSARCSQVMTMTSSYSSRRWCTDSPRSATVVRPTA